MYSNKKFNTMKQTHDFTRLESSNQVYDFINDNSLMNLMNDYYKVDQSNGRLDLSLCFDFKPYNLTVASKTGEMVTKKRKRISLKDDYYTLSSFEKKRHVEFLFRFLQHYARPLRDLECVFVKNSQPCRYYFSKPVYFYPEKGHLKLKMKSVPDETKIEIHDDWNTPPLFHLMKKYLAGNASGGISQCSIPVEFFSGAIIQY